MADYKTGDRVDRTGQYDWVKYTDGTQSPAPSAEEKRIPLSRGEVVPPVHSCNKGAWYRFVG